jgi:hypothetical protein
MSKYLSGRPTDGRRMRHSPKRHILSARHSGDCSRGGMSRLPCRTRHTSTYSAPIRSRRHRRGNSDPLSPQRPGSPARAARPVCGSLACRGGPSRGVHGGATRTLAKLRVEAGIHDRRGLRNGTCQQESANVHPVLVPADQLADVFAAGAVAAPAHVVVDGLIPSSCAAWQNLAGTRRRPRR